MAWILRQLPCWHAGSLSEHSCKPGRLVEDCGQNAPFTQRQLVCTMSRAARNADAIMQAAPHLLGPTQTWPPSGISPIVAP